MSFYEQHHVPRHTFIEDVTHNITNVSYYISQKDQEIINNPTIFL